MNTHVRERDFHAPPLFVEVTPNLRSALEALAEATIAALDAIDGDTDGEDHGARGDGEGAHGDFEPRRGWRNATCGHGSTWLSTANREG